MLISMETGASGGVQAQTGTFTISDQASVHVDLPFKAKSLFIMYGVNKTWTNYSIGLMYDESISNSTQYRMYHSGSSGGADTAALPTTSGDFIQNIDSTGFDFKTTNTSIWAGTYYYSAIG